MSSPPNCPTVAIANLGAGGGASTSLADLITAETRLNCQNAVLVRSRAMSIASIGAGSDKDRNAAARDLGAQFALCGRIHDQNDQHRHLALLDTRSGVSALRATHSPRTIFGANANHVPMVAGEMATTGVAPISVVAPARLAASYSETDLYAPFATYGYIASQYGARVKGALAELAALDDAGRATAARQDMLRVAANMRLLERHSAAEHGNDLTEQALHLDLKDPTDQLARGDTLLSLGAPP